MTGFIQPLGVDIHQDRPTEILHTILLGVVKYYWAQTVYLLEKGKSFAQFQARPNSIVTDGLNVPKMQADYMCRYRGSLIRKHFKTISQVMAFTIYNLVLLDVLEAWLIVGKLTVLLWHTKIEDIDSYVVCFSSNPINGCKFIHRTQTELEECINNFMNITCKCSPSILVVKPKFHFLLPLPFFIRHFGPAVLFSSERYEAYNAVFRASSVYSNRLCPSRDIAWAFAGMDHVKHIVTGGYWQDRSTKKWVCASLCIMNHILENPVHVALIGLPTTKLKQPGKISRIA